MPCTVSGFEDYRTDSRISKLRLLLTTVKCGFPTATLANLPLPMPILTLSIAKLVNSPTLLKLPWLLPLLKLPKTLCVRLAKTLLSKVVLNPLGSLIALINASRLLSKITVVIKLLGPFMQLLLYLFLEYKSCSTLNLMLIRNGSMALRLNCHPSNRNHTSALRSLTCCGLLATEQDVLRLLLRWLSQQISIL